MKKFGKELVSVGVIGASFGFAYGLAIVAVDKIYDWWNNRKRKEVFDVPQEED